MSVTFSGAFTFSGGGFTATLAPTGPVGYFGGGEYPYKSTVDRIVYANDTVTATIRGPLSVARRDVAATGTSSYGWYAGGDNPTKFSTIDRIDYAADTATASVRGPLTQSITGSTGVTDGTTYGWFSLAITAGSGTISNNNRVTFATDTATASLRGTLSASAYRAGTSTSTYGWMAGGLSGPSALSSIDRIDYANDTGAGSTRGPLSVITYGMGSAGNPSYGWFTGGGSPGIPSFSSRVQRITYATDTATASVRGPLFEAVYNNAANGNDSYGWVGGGRTIGGSATSNISRIDYANDTATSSLRGPLSSARYTMGATSGVAT
jgi:hypothetical protein